MRQPATNSIVAVPLVVVASVYVVAVAVKVPLTVTDPEIVALVQERGSRPIAPGSMEPERSRQDEDTVQLPTTEPSQAVTSGQRGGPLPPEPPLVPPEPVPEPPEPVLPPVPEVPELGEHPTEIVNMAIANDSRGSCSFFMGFILRPRSAQSTSH
jgi:hypothetical protein